MKAQFISISAFLFCLAFQMSGFELKWCNIGRPTADGAFPCPLGEVSAHLEYQPISGGLKKSIKLNGIEDPFNVGYCSAEREPRSVSLFAWLVGKNPYENFHEEQHASGPFKALLKIEIPQGAFEVSFVARADDKLLAVIDNASCRIVLYRIKEDISASCFDIRKSVDTSAIEPIAWSDSWLKRSLALTNATKKRLTVKLNSVFEKSQILHLEPATEIDREQQVVVYGNQLESISWGDDSDAGVRSVHRSFHSGEELFASELTITENGLSVGLKEIASVQRAIKIVNLTAEPIVVSIVPETDFRQIIDLGAKEVKEVVFAGQHLSKMSWRSKSEKLTGTVQSDELGSAIYVISDDGVLTTLGVRNSVAVETFCSATHVGLVNTINELKDLRVRDELQFTMLYSAESKMHNQCVEDKRALELEKNQLNERIADLQRIIEESERIIVSASDKMADISKEAGETRQLYSQTLQRLEDCINGASCEEKNPALVQLREELSAVYAQLESERERVCIAGIESKPLYTDGRVHEGSISID